MNARMILASVTGAMLLVSPVVASAASTKDAKSTTAPAKVKKAKTHKAAKPKAAATTTKDAKAK